MTSPSSISAVWTVTNSVIPLRVSPVMQTGGIASASAAAPGSRFSARADPFSATVVPFGRT